MHESAASACSAAACQRVAGGRHSPALRGRRTARLWQCTPQGSCVPCCMYLCAYYQCTHPLADAPTGLALLPLQDGGTTTNSWMPLALLPLQDGGTTTYSGMPLALSCCRAQAASAVTAGSVAKAASADDGYHRGGAATTKHPATARAPQTP
jgi:hypothetical protein